MTSPATKTTMTMEGNEGAALIAHKLSEVIAIYPITPSSLMGELSDAWSAKGKTNLWGVVPDVIELQSEGGASGSVHGALATGSLSTTFTASQGLLLMIPNMYKIAGELTPTVFHVTARAVASHALSIFGDHGDIYACRQTGWAMLASTNVQEAHDMAAIAHAATLKSRIPFLHFFDGFRTSHEIGKVELIGDDVLRAMIDEHAIGEHRRRALNPDHPTIRGTAQNPDVFFQAREACEPFYRRCPGIVAEVMDEFARLTGRAYRLFDYEGAVDAERVIVVMGSGAETARETARHLAAKGEKVGVVTVRVYRPFSVEHFVRCLPRTVKEIAVLDRVKEPGSVGEPLYCDVVAAIDKGLEMKAAPFDRAPRVIGGRYGLSSKEFTPAQVKAVFDELAKPHPRDRFTVGIVDDVSRSSLDYDAAFSIETDRCVRCLFFGLGSDGTVGANKNSIKIIGEETDNYAQGYFVYDSKKSGSVTISHLRFGPDPIRAPYLVDRAQFVACHVPVFMESLDVLSNAAPGATFLLNSHHDVGSVWASLPADAQRQIIAKKLRFYVIDAYKVAKDTGMGGRINTVMQTCFFAISGVLPRDLAISKIKESIKKTYGKRGDAVVQQNFAAVDKTLENLHEVKVPATVSSTVAMRPPVTANATDFVKSVVGPIISFKGDSLPVSAMPVDGTFPTGTAAYEKRRVGLEVPVWETDLCIQCGKCSFVCPHAVIRQKVIDPKDLAKAPAGFQTKKGTFKELPDAQFTIQVSPDDCTGCGLCVEVCPAKDKAKVGRKAINMVEVDGVREKQNRDWEFFLSLPEVDRTKIAPTTVKASQLYQPLFEFSGACAGCGETPYVKLVTQLFGDRAVIANATGCSSIYGGNLPTTPYTFNREGRGPAWANSLFEDNAEFGLGMRLAVDNQAEIARGLVRRFATKLGDQTVKDLIENPQKGEAEIAVARAAVERVRTALKGATDREAQSLLSVVESLVRRSVWIFGGDGWAYDIGYGGLDHVLATGRNVKVLVMDTEVYSNTGGQASKATPKGAVAKFAAKGKPLGKKDLGLMAMAYGHIYVAKVAMGANDAQTLKAFLEADAYDGPALIIAYSHCIAHGINMRKGLEQQKLAVNSGHWQMFRYNPDLAVAGQNPLTLDSKDPTVSLESYTANETRYRMLQQSDPERAAELSQQASSDIKARHLFYQQMAAMQVAKQGDGAEKH
ncbi:MAG: pyruvate:ferredoxin (flavodoxin) oxidoreductase [Planctomycetes bacterium]|nr:pyruvate:ferredoxin (flavodoxin) oxidoreductase [Planctomycetota bacterium]